MKVLRGFGIGILSFLLFLSLSVFGIAFTINSTLLNPDFVAREVDRIDMPTLIRELTEERIVQLPEEASFIKEAIYEVISDQEPWLKGQIRAAIYSGYEFLLGRSDRLEIAVSLDTLKETLRESLWQTFRENLPPELSFLPQDQLEPYFDQYYREFAGGIPSVLTLDESSIPPEVMEQLMLARQYIGYFRTYYYYLIGFMVLLVAGIILLNRSVRGTTRSLGTDFMIYGALEFAGVYLARNYGLANMSLPGVPPSLQTWLSGLFGDLLAPLQTFSLVLLIGGAVLLIVSFIYKPRAAGD